MSDNDISADSSLSRLEAENAFDADDPSTRDGGIGTLGEKTLHAALKNYYEPDPRLHEIRYKGLVADIMRDGEIIEIQTGSFFHLRRKLEVFCAENSVTVVYPIARSKNIVTVDPETGEALSKRRSPKKGTPYEAYAELIHIMPFLKEPNLTVRAVMVDLDEYRVFRGKPVRHNKGYSRTERVPVAFGEEFEIGKRTGWRALIPSEIEVMDYFTIRDFSGFSGLTYYRANAAIKVLCAAGAVERIVRPEAEKAARAGRDASETEKAAVRAANMSRSRNFYRVVQASASADT